MARTHPLAKANVHQKCASHHHWKQLTSDDFRNFQRLWSLTPVLDSQHNTCHYALSWSMQLFEIIRPLQTSIPCKRTKHPKSLRFVRSCDRVSLIPFTLRTHLIKHAHVCTHSQNTVKYHNLVTAVRTPYSAFTSRKSWCILLQT